MTRAGEAAEGQNGSSIVILILGLAGGFGTLCGGARCRKAARGECAPQEQAGRSGEQGAGQRIDHQVWTGLSAARSSRGAIARCVLVLLCGEQAASHASGGIVGADLKGDLQEAAVQGDARQYTNLHDSPRQYPFVDGIEYLFAKLDCECKECCDDRDHHPCFAPTLLARDDPCAPYRVHVHLNGIARIRVQSAAFDDHWWRGRVEGMELQDQPDAIAVFTQSRDSWLVRNETTWSV